MKDNRKLIARYDARLGAFLAPDPTGKNPEGNLARRIRLTSESLPHGMRVLGVYEEDGRNVERIFAVVVDLPLYGPRFVEPSAARRTDPVLLSPWTTVEVLTLTAGPSWHPFEDLVVDVSDVFLSAIVLSGGAPKRVEVAGERHSDSEEVENLVRLDGRRPERSDG